MFLYGTAFCNLCPPNLLMRASINTAYEIIIPDAHMHKIRASIAVLYQAFSCSAGFHVFAIPVKGTTNMRLWNFLTAAP